MPREAWLENIQGLQSGRISWIYAAPNSHLWIGHEYGLFRYADGQMERVKDRTPDQLRSSHFLCCYADDDGTLWMSTSDEVVRYNSGRFEAITAEQGLPADDVDRLHADELGTTIV